MKWSATWAMAVLTMAVVTITQPKPVVATPSPSVTPTLGPCECITDEECEALPEDTVCPDYEDDTE